MINGLIRVTHASIYIRAKQIRIGRFRRRGQPLRSTNYPGRVLMQWFKMRQCRSDDLIPI